MNLSSQRKTYGVNFLHSLTLSNVSSVQTIPLFKTPFI